MPTLYSDDHYRKPRVSVIEMLLYNMAAMLAGVATGYDVRMSNVSPVHPMLQPASILNDSGGMAGAQLIESEFAVGVADRTLGRNTYHGPTRHHRPMLTAMSLVPDDTPIRLIDSPQHFLQSTVSTTSGLGSNFTTNTSSGLSSSLGGVSTLPPTPSPRRKMSGSSFTENESDYVDRGGLFRFESRPPLYVPGDYLVRQPVSNENIGNFRSGYFGSNYFPHRPEVHLAYERDCKSYPDYSYEHPRYHEYGYEPGRPPRVPQMGVTASGHRRTLSNMSSQSNINQAFRTDPDEMPSSAVYDLNRLALNDQPPALPREYRPVADHVNTSLQFSSPNRMHNYENLSFHQNQNNYLTLNIVPPPQNPLCSTVYEPVSIVNRLGFEHGGTTTVDSPTGTRLRSSLKKYSTSNQKLNTSGNSGSGTPTNPTPPDSVGSDDSSYLSAKDSISSQQSRVRFSPELQMNQQYSLFPQAPQQHQQQQQQQPFPSQNVVDVTASPLQKVIVTSSANTTPIKRIARRHTGDMAS